MSWRLKPPPIMRPCIVCDRLTKLTIGKAHYKIKDVYYSILIGVPLCEIHWEDWNRWYGKAQLVTNAPVPIGKAWEKLFIDFLLNNHIAISKLRRYQVMSNPPFIFR